MGFNLFCAFVLLPLTCVFVLIWIVSGKKIYGKILGIIWLSIFVLLLLSITIGFFIQQKVLDKDDIYGEYIIDRTKFSGKQSDWQYNHYQFEITKQNEFLFHQTEYDKILKTNKGTIKFLEAYKQPRIIIQVDTPRHHIIEEKPTLYLEVWSYYYVFKSPKFGNVFFTKGKWKPIKNQ